MNLCYIDAPTGLAGDMLLAALVAAGADGDELVAALRRLPLDGWTLGFSRQNESGLACCRTEIFCPEQHCHRHLPEIQQMIAAAHFPPRAQALALSAFEILAEAEGRVHDCPPEQVHFHEVGAMDSILDICGVALALDMLKIDRVWCAPLPLSRGWVDCAHGRLPVPAPAVRELLTGFTLVGTELEGELITPTGAALLRAAGARQTTLPSFTLAGQGRGLGRRVLPVLNAVSLYWGPATEEPGLESDWVEILSANVDDGSGELLAAFAGQAFAQGALDVCFVPLTMKKSRPGWQIQVITADGQGEALARLLLAQTSAIGCRISRSRRLKLLRQLVQVETVYGPVTVKVAGDTLAPEADSVSSQAAAAEVSFKQVYTAALAAAYAEQARRDK